MGEQDQILRIPNNRSGDRSGCYPTQLSELAMILVTIKFLIAGLFTADLLKTKLAMKLVTLVMISLKTAISLEILMKWCKNRVHVCHPCGALG